MMMTRGSAEVREEHKHDSMLELLEDDLTQPLKRDGRRILNTHLVYDDMPPAMLSNTRHSV